MIEDWKIMQHYKLTIEYDGAGFHGWQIQAGEATIQGTIQKALSRMTGESIVLHGSGRTDAGVHALGQTASFRTAARIPPAAYVAGLNSLLPGDIVIRACEPVDETFHARFSAKNKTYRYQILNAPLPSALLRRYAWHVRKPLDLAAMKHATAFIKGERDFKSFEGAGSPRESTIRKVTRAEVGQTETGLVAFTITANGFLRFMVRNLVGTLVDVGLGKTTVEGFERILAAKNRNAAGVTAPPQGLFLVEVCYDEGL